MSKGVYSWTRESQIWVALKDHAKAAHLERIESPMTGAGRPDVEGCLYGHQAWVELKIIRGGVVKISDRQAQWHTNRANAQGRSWILAWDNKIQTLYLWQGKDAWDIQRHGIAIVPCNTFPCPIQWGDLIHEIFYVAP